MPFYEYQCRNCGHELEAMQKISDEPLKKCPHCGKSQLQRLISAPVFRLKGGGWYETDFKDDKDKKRNLADRPDADKPAESDSKSEAKPAEPKVESVSKTESKPTGAAADKSSAGTGKSNTKKTPARKKLAAAKKSGKSKKSR